MHQLRKKRKWLRSRSNPFELHRSTRQGCNVSPLIFILALEPLACAIRAHKEIYGITICDYEYKANLFADDILLTLSKPNYSIPQVLNLIDNFGKFSGYRVNYNKSEAIPLNNLTFQSHLGSAPFSWKPKGMKYLGIKIQAPIDKLVEINAPDLLKTIRDDTKRWAVLPLSLWGRSEVIKMNLLPRLTFLMSSIPLKFPPSWFKEINKIFSGFLWNYKKPRISQKKLKNPRPSGGIGLPDIYQYYIAYNARYPLQWAYNRNREVGSCEWLEEQLISKGIALY
uniref:Reverse transcriptase domain-containing protein n=1 Tax=Myripristis murdjan TaxID=586833 RepID=A0A667XFI8_9TELE